MRRAYLLFFFISFLAGVLLRTLFDFGEYFFVYTLSLAFISAILLRSSGKKLAEPFNIAVLIFIIALSLGGLRAQLSEKEPALDHLLNQDITFNAVVVTEPERKEKLTQFVVEDADTRQKIYVRTELASGISFADHIEIKGTLRVPSNFYTSDSLQAGTSFNWVSYLAKDDIFYEMFFPEITTKEQAGLSASLTIKKWLFGIKNVFVGNIQSVIREPAASLAAGETLGERTSLGKVLEEDLRTTGVIHVVVLSGYNVTLVSDSLIKILGFLPRVAGAYMGIFGIILFTLMTGASATVVRAAIMGSLVILARRYGNLYDITIALVFTAFVMVLHNPDILLYDASFQLSFMATAGLIYLAPKLKEKMKFLPERFNIREIVSATVGTQIFILPLLVTLTGKVSLVSVVVNALVLPVVPITMFLTFLTATLGFISSSLSYIIALPTSLVLMYQLGVVNIFAGLPFASISIPKSFFLLIVSLYAILWFVYYYKRIKREV